MGFNPLAPARQIGFNQVPEPMLGANVSNVPDCEEATKNGYIDASDAQIRTYEAKHYFYPIPTTQLTLNKNMKQNPGW